MLQHLLLNGLRCRIFVIILVSDLATIGNALMDAAHVRVKER